MDKDLFLAMDAYNRGYGQSVKLDADDEMSGVNELGRTLGNARIIQQSDVNPGDPGFAASFYAIAYDWNGETIISYRGTDDKTSDFFAFGIGAGQPFSLTGGLTDQARLTIEFYRAVAGANANPFAANITTTGHSLGGGLVRRSANDNSHDERKAA